MSFEKGILATPLLIIFHIALVPSIIQRISHVGPSFSAMKRGLLLFLPIARSMSLWRRKTFWTSRSGRLCPSRISLRSRPGLPMDPHLGTRRIWITRRRGKWKASSTEVYEEFVLASINFFFSDLSAWRKSRGLLYHLLRRQTTVHSSPSTCPLFWLTSYR